MLFILILGLVALVLFGVGFVIHALWIVAFAVALVWLLGFVFRLGAGADRTRWYRW